MSNDEGYLIGSRAIDHATCTRGASGAWYPNFGQGVEIFGWDHDHDLQCLAEIASRRIEALNAEYQCPHEMFWGRCLFTEGHDGLHSNDPADIQGDRA